MGKKYDLRVKTGSYTVGGETKGRYITIGSIMEGERGEFMLLSRTFNPSGVDVEPGRDSIVVSMVAPRDFEDDIPAKGGKDRVPF